MIGNGYPIFAEGQVGALYPFNLILFRLFSTILAYNLNIIIHFLMAAVFTYLFVKNLGLSKKASFLSAISYSLSGFMVIHIHQININMVITYLPLTLLAVDKILTGNKLWFSFLTLGFVMQILAGHIEMFYYCLGITGIYFLLKLFIFPSSRTPVTERENVEKRYLENKQESEMKSKYAENNVKNNGSKPFFSIAVFILAVVCAFGIAFIQLSATYELNQQSQRSEGLQIEHATSTLWPPETLELFVNPRKYALYRVEEGYTPTGTTVNTQALYGYIGIIPLLLAFGAIIFTRKKITFLFSILMFLALFYGMGRSTQFFAIFWNLIPGLKYFRFPTKILFLIEFCLAVLAGVGLDYLTSTIYKNSGVLSFTGSKKSKLLFHISQKRLNTIAFLILILSLADLLYFNAFGTRKIINANQWLSIPESAEILSKKIGDPYLYRIYDHGMSNIDYSYATNEEYQKVFRNMLPIDFNMIYKIPTNQEWAVLFLERQSKLNSENTRVDFEKGTISLTPAHKKALALQAVRYMVSDVEINDSDLTEIGGIPFPTEVNHIFYINDGTGMSKVQFPVSGVHIYENKFFYPRVGFVTGVIRAASADEAYKMVLDPEFNPAESVVLEDFDNDQNTPEGQSTDKVISAGNAEIVKDEEDQLEIKVVSKSAGILVLADTYYPGWHAFVDGNESRVLRANYNFRGVEVGSGEHTIIMKYEPTYWKFAEKIVIFSLFAFVLISAGIISLNLYKKSRINKK